MKAKMRAAPKVLRGVFRLPGINGGDGRRGSEGQKKGGESKGSPEELDIDDDGYEHHDRDEDI